MIMSHCPSYSLSIRPSVFVYGITYTFEIFAAFCKRPDWEKEWNYQPFQVFSFHSCNYRCACWKTIPSALGLTKGEKVNNIYFLMYFPKGKKNNYCLLYSRAFILSFICSSFLSFLPLTSSKRNKVFMWNFAHIFAFKNGGFKAEAWKKQRH